MLLHKGLTASIICSLIGAAAYAQPVMLIEAGRVLDVRTGAYANNQGILVENPYYVGPDEFLRSVPAA